MRGRPGVGRQALSRPPGSSGLTPQLSPCTVGRKSRATRLRVEAVAQVGTRETAVQDGAPKTAQQYSSVSSLSSMDMVPGDDQSIMTAKINAVASKINAARELARRLSEEKQAGEVKANEVEMRRTQEATSVAAAEAARADALARALRKAETTRDQLQRLKAENEALRELLLELAADKEAAQARLGQVAEAAASLSTRPGGAVLQDGTAAPVVDIPPPTAAGTVAPMAPTPPAAAGAPSPPAAAAAAPTTAPTAPTPVVPAPVSPPAPEVAPPPPVEAAAAAAPPAAPPAPAEPVVAAPKGVLQQHRPTRAPTVQERVSVSTQELRQLAAQALAAGKNTFTQPKQPVSIDGPVRIFYNRAKGPLPATASVVMKAGFNKWDIVQELDMRPAEILGTSSDQQWWEVTLDIPAETFRVDYVFYDKRSLLYDNNSFRDYMLELADAPTEQQLLDLKLEAYRNFEGQRLKFLEAENARLWRAVEVAALEAAGAARIEFRKRRDASIRAEAEALVAARRQAELGGASKPIMTAKAGVFSWTTPPKAGQRAFLAYNRSHGPLNHSNNVRVHVGTDGWVNQFKQTYDMSTMGQGDVEKASLGPGQWWGCWVDVPKNARVLDFVLSDTQQTMWDNNDYKDYHTAIQDTVSAEKMSEQLVQTIAKEKEQLHQEMEDRVARQAYAKMISRGEVLRKRRAAWNQFLYTVPYTPVAGQTVEIYYNPEHTPLRGRPNIYCQVGFNRWTWNQDHQCAPIRVKMEPTVAGGIGFYTAQVELPEDAWGLDMVFIDTADVTQATGFYDNNQGLDYHLPLRTPVDGNKPIGAVNMPAHMPLKVVHVAVEMAPIAKVGGMGDVVTALGRAVQEEGHQVEVVLPKYDCLDYKQVEGLRQDASFAYGGTQVRVWRGVVEGLVTTFLEPENGHFWRGVIYGRNDDHVRFGFHCGAALVYLQQFGVRPHIIHCHDWQSAPIAWGNRGSSRCVFTIHNLSYGADMVGRAMASCELATTVSATYAREISGQGVIAPHLDKLYGILNGIDTDVWDPAVDEFIPLPYCAETAQAGKEAARRELRNRLKLSHIDVPIISVVTRLVAQKGIHLIKHAAWRTLERGGQFVLLGSAPDPRVQAEFNALRDQLKAQYHDRAALEFTYNEPLSHLIYAGSDMFLVPSMFEPCGLTQMISMKYGTVPVVRKTGGLADTVFDLDHDEERAAAAGMEANGFTFESTDNAGLDYALNRAMSMWYSDRAGWQRLVANIMRQDWSWFKPALDYIDLYYKALRS